MDTVVKVILGCFIFVMLTDCEKIRNQQEDNLPSGSSVECIIYNVTSLNCSWYPAMTECQSTLGFWQMGQVKECPVYLKDNRRGRNKCHFQSISIIRDVQFTVQINVSVSLLPNLSFSQMFEPYEIEKLNPPLDFRYSLKKESFSLFWKPPPTKDPIMKNCFVYQLIIKGMDSKHKENITLNEKTSYTTETDITKRYAFKLRVRGTKDCGFGNIWSEWTEETYEGTGKYSDVLIFTSLATLTLILTLILLYVFKRYKLIDKIFPAIPHPKEKMAEWFLNFGKGERDYCQRLQVPVEVI
uniref:Granulocyte-macrophage colony-stimulating factor receptor subunit alpha-like n=1 Tax=Lepisosteus oculatus TaxID=7918 RepID=W5M3R5_LEPOC|nr:PREDICTED: granulocyte-macrophage colony-stimulating factor receptor subunit alpha-like [Lepisosteus oculatus]